MTAEEIIAGLRREQEQNDLGELALLPAFRRFLVMLRERCGVDAPVFGDSPDPLRGARQDGERIVAIRIWANAQAVAPDMVQRGLNDFASLQRTWAKRAELKLAEEKAKENT